MQKSYIVATLLISISLLASCSHSSSSNDVISPVAPTIEDMNGSPVQDMDMGDSLIQSVNGGR